MTEILSSSPRTRVIIPKTGFKEDSRNPLAKLFRTAGYDKVADGEFDDSDKVVDIQQGDYEFVGVKGASALAFQMQRATAQEGIPIIMGGDILFDAQMRLRERNIKLQLKKILDMNVGPCSLQFLSPVENQMITQEDIVGRTLFTKYPALLRASLKSWGIKGDEKDIWELNGADTRVAEARDDGNIETAAFEIVGSGETARKNRLSTLMLPSDTFDFENVTTDLYLGNPSGITNYSRDRIADLGLALEMSMVENTRTLIKFNAPQNILESFREYGEQGPTCSPIMSKDTNSQQWFALEIAVPNRDANRIVREITARGATGIVPPERNAPMGISREKSQIFRELY